MILNPIKSGINTNDATATAEDIKAGETAYAKGQKLIGTLEVLDTSDATASANDIANNKTAYVNGEKVTGNVFETSGNAARNATSIFKNADLNALDVNYTFNESTMFRVPASLHLYSPMSNFGDATANDVAAGKTFTSENGLKATGNLIVLDTSDATATTSDIKTGKTAYVDGRKLTGTASLAKTSADVTVTRSGVVDGVDDISFDGTELTFRIYKGHSTITSVTVILS